MHTMKKTLIATLMFVFPFVLSGQTLDDAKDLYNKGAKVFGTDKDSALIYFENSLGMCKTLGTPADSLRMKLETFIPSLYFDIANDAYKARRLDEALVKAQKSLDVAQLYKDERNTDKSSKLLVAINFVMGNNYFRKSDLDNAIKYYEITVKLDPNEEKAWYNMALAYLKKSDADKMVAAMDKTFELCKAENDTLTISRAKMQCRDFFYKQGIGQYQKNQDEAALSSMTKSLGYDEKYVDAYYIMATIYLKDKKANEALVALNNGLKYETVPAKTARLYFQMGYAYVALKKNADACTAFNKVIELKDKDLAPKAVEILKKNPVICEKK